MGSFAAHGSRYRGGSGNGGGPGNAGKHFSFQGWGLVQEWEARSACRDTPIELWFGEERPFGDKRSYRTQQQTAQAKAICAGCRSSMTAGSGPWRPAHPTASSGR
jgi:hypothetical protein